MSFPTLHLIYTDRFKEHETGSHPERPERMDAAYESLHQNLAAGLTQWHQPRMASEEELQLVHSKQHISHIKALAEQGGGLADPDTLVTSNSYEVARLSAGALLHGVDLLLGENERRAFALSRPPGHHARPASAMGFCLFSNIAVAARYAQKRYGLERILILDFDVHHGNGTQEVFYSDNSVFFLSTHQHPHYPGTGLAEETGEGAGKGYTANLPYPPLTDAQTIVNAVARTLDQVTPQFEPQFLMISAGFDGHRDDPLGNWLLLEEHFVQMTQEACKQAQNHTQGKVLACLEGGYNLKSLASSCTAHCQALIEH